MAPARPRAIDASHDVGPLMLRNTSPGVSILAITPATRPSSTAPSMMALPSGIDACSARIEQLGRQRRKPRGVGQALVHGPAGAAFARPVALGHERVDVAPVGAGQLGRVGRPGPEQPGRLGVALDGRALGHRLVQAPRQVHRLVGQDVHGHHLVAGGPALVRARVGGQVAALVALDQGPRLRGPVGPPAHVAELGAGVDEGPAEALAAHRHPGPGQHRGGPAEAPLLGGPEHPRDGGAGPHGQQQGHGHPGEPSLPAQLVGAAQAPADRDHGRPGQQGDRQPGQHRSSLRRRRTASSGSYRQIRRRREPGRPPGIRSAAQDPVHHLEQLVDLGLAAAGLDLVADAAADVAVEQAERDLVDGGLDGRDLGDHVDAVLVLVDHAGHAADLALDAAQPGLQLLLLHGVAGHGASSACMPYTRVEYLMVPGVGIHGASEVALATRVDLPIEGMTCGACAARIERGLNRIDGVASASVNLAAERATVVYDPAVTGPPAFSDKVAALGYAVGRDPGADGDAPPTRLLAAAALTVPVLALGMFPALQYPGWAWLSAVLATPVVLWAGAGFHRAALAGLRHRAATMDTLVSLGTLAAWGWSVSALLAAGPGDPAPGEPGGAHLYFEVAAIIVVLILFGRWLEQRARSRSGQALRRLAELGSGTAMVLRDGAEVPVPVEQVAVGDRFVVRPGQKLATDGVVEEGRSSIDRSLLTGESVPVEAGPGDEVTGATVNLEGRLVVRATRVGADTALAQIVRLVEAAQGSKAPVQRLADRVAGVFVPW